MAMLKIARALRLRRVGSGNGRIEDIDEAVKVMSAALSELLRPIVERMWYEKQQNKPNTLGLSARENAFLYCLESQRPDCDTRASLRVSSFLNSSNRRAAGASRRRKSRSNGSSGAVPNNG